MPNDIVKIIPGLRGCGEVNTDFESDEIPDGNDECLQDPAKTCIGQVQALKIIVYGIYSRVT
jgi:hypothetical protein